MTRRPLVALFGSPLVALLAALSAGCSSTPPIVVGSDLDNAPFAYRDAQGQAAGRDVDMMIAIAHMLDRELVWKHLDFAELLPAAEAGRVDVVCATLGVTPERSRRVAFTRPYFSTELVVLVREDPSAPSSLRELEARKVAAAPGTTSQRAVEQLLPEAIGVFETAAPGQPSSLERLLAGEVDALVLDGPAADAALAAQPGKLRRLPGLFTPEHYALALPKDRSALRDQIDDCLRTLQVGGSLQRWNGMYGLQEVHTAGAPD
ncbi:MAG TPA: ABC transporter substrate-binding protein [Planctomycetota bacterium]|nr:ABC transporter substrate-binding protein [Planctomycetota bacterium]